MGKQAKISAIKKEYTNLQETMDSQLSNKGLTRIPGTGVFKFPYKEINGKYRTGLDPDAAYINRIEDSTERELEKKRVAETKKRLEASLGGIDLGPYSTFWDYSKSQGTYDTNHIQPVKLLDGDNYFDLGIPFQELTFSWLRVHPTIARNLAAWQNGEYPADTQFYVADDEIENAVIYNKKKLINKAIVKFDNMSPERKKKVARLLGLPITDDTKEEVVYNLVDNLLKEGDFKKGPNQGLSTIEVFSRFADMDDSLLTVKDLVKQSIAHSIYRVRANGRIYEGEFEIAITEEELVKTLMSDDHQEDLILLQEKLKTKKIAKS